MPLIEVSQQQLYTILVSLLSSADNTDIIRYLIECIDLPQFPKLYLLLGDYFNRINDFESMLKYYNLGITNIGKSSTKHRILVKLATHYLLQSKDINNPDYLNVIKQVTNKKFYYELAKKIILQLPDIAIDMCNKYPSNDRMDLCRKICVIFSKWSYI